MVLLVVNGVVATRLAAALVATQPLVVLRLAVDLAAARPLVVLRLVIWVELPLTFQERAYRTLDRNGLLGITYDHIERKRWAIVVHSYHLLLA